MRRTSGGKHVELAVMTRTPASQRTWWPGEGYEPNYSKMSFYGRGVTDSKEVRRATVGEAEPR